jgi:hypothetical protein
MGRRTVHGKYTTYAKGCRCERCRASWAAYMAEYKARSSGTYYAGKQVSVRVRLTPLAEKILRQAEARTGQTRDDVVEAVLRECGGSVEFAA